MATLGGLQDGHHHPSRGLTPAAVLSAGFAVVLLLLADVPYSQGNPRMHHKRGAVLFRQEVTTDNGVLVGEIVRRGTGSYFAFRGVPYAAAPLAELRFKGPRPAPHWGRREAFKEGPKCAQTAFPSRRVEGQEDCLYLNVYVPTLGGNQIPADSKLPVMVYIHGGGFQYGSGTGAENGPEFIVHHDVILVTFNYRLAAMGFLSLDTDDIPGNMGLKDQHAVLQWVRRNIRQFGGDPNKVTIFGNSAGGASVHYHTLLKASQGLFSAAIMQSGNALASFAYQETHLEMARRLCQELTGKEISDAKQVAEAIRKANTSAILAATDRVIESDASLRLGNPPFSPSPERRRRGSEETFLVQDPESLVRQPQVPLVPTIIGLTGEEGYFVWKYGSLNTEPGLATALAKNPALLLSANLLPYKDTARLLGIHRNASLTSEQSARFGTTIQQQYQLVDANSSGFTTLLGDLFTGVSTHRLVDLRLRGGCKSPLYLYNFLQDGEYNWGKRSLNITAPVPTHTDELGFLMHITSPVDLKQSLFGTSSSSKTLFLLTRMWTDFAKTKVPDRHGWPEARGTAQSANYVKIVSNALTQAHGLSAQRMAMWEDIFAELRRP